MFGEERHSGGNKTANYDLVSKFLPSSIYTKKTLLGLKKNFPPLVLPGRTNVIASTCVHKAIVLPSIQNRLDSNHLSPI